MEHFESCYETLKRNEFGPIMNRWKELAIVIGREVMVEEIGTKYRGRVENIDDTGVLIVRDDRGTVHRVFLADVTLLDK